MNNIMQMIKNKLKGSTTMPGGTAAAKKGHDHHMHGGACCGHDHGHDHHHDHDEDHTTPGKGGCCG